MEKYSLLYFMVYNQRNEVFNTVLKNSSYWKPYLLIYQFQFLKSYMGTCGSASDTTAQPKKVTSLSDPSAPPESSIIQRYMSISQQISKYPKLTPSHRQAHLTIKTTISSLPSLFSSPSPASTASLLNLAKACQCLQLHNSAIYCYQQYEKAEKEPQLRAIAARNRAQCYLEIGRPGLAGPLLEGLLEHEEKFNGRKTYEYIRLLWKFGEARAMLGFQGQAIAVLEEVSVLMKHLQLVNTPQQCEVLCKLGQLYLQIGQPHKSIQKIFQTLPSPRCAGTPELLYSLSQLLHKLSLSPCLSSSLSASTLSLSLHLCNKSLESTLTNTTTPEYLLKQFHKFAILKSQEHYLQAQLQLKECQPILLEIVGRESVLYGEFLVYWGILHLGLGNNVAGIRSLIDGVNLYGQLGEANQEIVGFMYLQMAYGYANIGSLTKFKEAAEKAEQVINMLEGQSSQQSIQFAMKLLETIPSTPEEQLKQTRQLLYIHDTLNNPHNPTRQHLKLSLAKLLMDEGQTDECMSLCEQVIQEGQGEEKGDIDCFGVVEACRIMVKLAQQYGLQGINTEQMKVKIDHFETQLQKSVSELNQLYDI